MQKNQIIHGEAANELSKMASGSVDLVVTDPPYLVNYKDRTGRTLKNDNDADGVLPVFEPMAQVLKYNAYCICFCGWSALPKFTAAWEAAGFRIVGQIVWKKRYASRKGYTEYRHETAYVLAKGNPAKPACPISDVQDWVYSGNKRHPTEKAVEVIAPLIRCFSKSGDLVLDPFSGSGSTSVAAVLNDREFIGIELEEAHCETARGRVGGAQAYKAKQSNQTQGVAA